MQTKDILALIQLILSIVIVFTVLMQQRGSGLGSLFGGPGSGGGGEYYRTRRGFEKFLFYFTIALASLLVITSFLYFFV